LLEALILLPEAAPLAQSPSSVLLPHPSLTGAPTPLLDRLVKEPLASGPKP
jgi:hypothetical protein